MNKYLIAIIIALVGVTPNYGYGELCKVEDAFGLMQAVSNPECTKLDFEDNITITVNKTIPIQYGLEVDTTGKKVAIVASPDMTDSFLISISASGTVKLKGLFLKGNANTKAIVGVSQSGVIIEKCTLSNAFSGIRIKNDLLGVKVSQNTYINISGKLISTNVENPIDEDTIDAELLDQNSWLLYANADKTGKVELYRKLNNTVEYVDTAMSFSIADNKYKFNFQLNLEDNPPDGEYLLNITIEPLLNDNEIDTTSGFTSVIIPLATDSFFNKLPNCEDAEWLYDEDGWYGWDNIPEGYQDTDYDCVLEEVGATDTDGDGINDDEDNCPTTPNADQSDWNNNGKGDACEDTDGDGILDIEEQPGCENNSDPSCGTDADGDGFAIPQDCNDNNASIHPEANEECDGVDNNCNGKIDELYPDTDKDNIADCVDEDDDNDGIKDVADNCPLIPNPNQADTNKNGIGDICEADMDGDGISDNIDNCPKVPNADQLDADKDGIGNECDTDMDNDGWSNLEDNCPYTFNIGQDDSDKDGVGDACEGDYDNDGVNDIIDNCRFKPNADQNDMDNDGKGDLCDTDIDGDNVIDIKDNCKYLYNPHQQDADNDGYGDPCDTDKDGDGILNSKDNCPLIPNPDQADTNENGIGDACEYSNLDINPLPDTDINKSQNWGLEVSGNGGCQLAAASTRMYLSAAFLLIPIAILSSLKKKYQRD